MLTVRFDRLGLGPGSTLLDVGCGGGRHIGETRRMPGVSAIAVDIGEPEVQGSRRHLQELDALGAPLGGSVPNAGPWACMRASVYELPFADQCFDCVILSEVLEHLHQDQRALVEIGRVLKHRGILALSVPREGPEVVCWALSHQYRNTPGGHLRIYRRARLRAMLEAQGYRIFDSHFAHALHAPWWWLKCLVGLDNDKSKLVSKYHELLVWDMMKKPWVTRTLEAALDPFIGKSVVFYGLKDF